MRVKKQTAGKGKIFRKAVFWYMKLNNKQGQKNARQKMQKMHRNKFCPGDENAKKNVKKIALFSRLAHHDVFPHVQDARAGQATHSPAQ